MTRLAILMIVVACVAAVGAVRQAGLFLVRLAPGALRLGRHDGCERDHRLWGAALVEQFLDQLEVLGLLPTAVSPLLVYERGEARSGGEKLPDGDEILQVDSYPLTIYSAAAVQELHALVKEKDAKIHARSELLAAQQAQITDLQARLERVEALLAGATPVHKGDSR